MFDAGGTNNATSLGVPSRGSILCVFLDPALVQTIEPAVSRRGFTLLRARSGMHGFWMAATAEPDVILTDVPVATNEKDYLLDGLARHRKTREIPVIALVDAAKQTETGPTCLRRAHRCLLKTSTVDEILRVAADLVQSQSATVEPAVPRLDRVLRVDAVFSEMGRFPARPNKRRSAYRQRGLRPADARSRDVATGKPGIQFDESHADDQRTFGRITSERLARHLPPAPSHDSER